LLSIRGLWMLVGFVAATVIFWMVNRKVLKLQAIAAENLAKTLDRQIAALEKERNEYREKLHMERNAHQACELRAKDLEARPDLTALTVLLSEQKDWMRSLGESLKQHSESDARIFGGIEQSFKVTNDALTKFPEQLKNMSDAFDQRQKEALAQIRNGKASH
jgi:hypothetical protein